MDSATKALDGHVAHFRTQRPSMPGSGQQDERIDVTRNHDAEMSMVKGGDLSCPQALSDGSDRRVHCTKSEIGVLLNQVRGTCQVAVNHMLDIEASGNEAAEEGSFYWSLCLASK